ncbi:unnamed protein product [Linum trigynum]|uniref:Uncharacterized protein n=1 Tax=Linum trigynum TaxID=586398 RepID=A0AAV2FHX7_9ROSI
MRVPIGPPEAEDKWIWRYTDSGSYTMRSAYRAFREARDRSIHLVNDDGARPNRQDRIGGGYGHFHFLPSSGSSFGKARKMLLQLKHAFSRASVLQPPPALYAIIRMRLFSIVFFIVSMLITHGYSVDY